MNFASALAFVHLGTIGCLRMRRKIQREPARKMPESAMGMRGVLLGRIVACWIV